MDEISPTDFVALQPHAFANLLPWIKDPEKFAELVGDIRKNGLISPIVLYQGQILDGRNRHRACLQLIAENAFELSAPHHIKRFNGTEAEALDFVESLNIHRRHLTKSQRALAASAMSELRLGTMAGVGLTPKNVEAVSDVATECNVSPFMVLAANKIRSRAPRHIVEMIEQGTVTIAAAERLLDLNLTTARLMKMTTPEAVNKAASVAGSRRLRPWTADRLMSTMGELLTELEKRKPDDIDLKRLSDLKARVREFRPQHEREREPA